MKYFRLLACILFILSLSTMSYAYPTMGNDCAACHGGGGGGAVPDGGGNDGGNTTPGCGSNTPTPPVAPGGNGCDPGTDPGTDPEPPSRVPAPTSSRACDYDIRGFGAVSSARVFHPCDMEAGVMYGATTLSGGMTNTKEQMYWLARELVRQNIIVFAISASNNMAVSGYERAHTDAIGKIKEENNRSGSPVAGKIGKIGISGFSMGGGATLNVSNSSAQDVDAAVAMAPFGPDSNLSRVDCPMLVIVGSNDTIAIPAMNAEPGYRRLPDGIAKAYATLPNYGHLQWMTGGGSQGNDTGKLITAWFRWAFYNDASAFQIVQNPPGRIRYNQKAGF